MSKDANRDTYFTEETKHALVEDFAVSYYNRSVDNKKFVPDLAQKSVNEINLRTAMSQTTLDKYKDSQIWSYDDYDGAYRSTYDYWVTFRDERFSELEDLLDKYTDRIEVPPTEKPLIEKKLYSLIMLLMREGRVPASFQLIPYRSAMMDRLGSGLERATKLIDNLEKRVKNIENNPFLKTGITK